MDPEEDPFDGVLNLEERYYREGYEEGYRDGAAAGRVEGRSVGYKTGFEKFLEAGRLQGRALVWANRIPGFRGDQDRQQEQGRESSPQGKDGKEPSPTRPPAATNPTTSPSSPPSSFPSQPASSSSSSRLPPIRHSSARLERNVATLYALVEPGTLSTRNDDESVSDFDSRMKGAQGKLRMIERVVGEGGLAGVDQSHPPAAGQTKNENIEDVRPLRRRSEDAVAAGRQ